MPTIFWVMGFLLLPENKAHLAAVIAEAQQAAGLAAPAAGTPAAAAPQQQQQGKGRGAGSSLLTLEQQQGLVSLACNRRSHVAAGVSETLRLRCFRLAGCCSSNYALLVRATASGLGIEQAACCLPRCLPCPCSIDVRIAAADGALPGGVDGSGPGIWVQKARWCRGRSSAYLQHACFRAIRPCRAICVLPHSHPLLPLLLRRAMWWPSLLMSRT